MPVRTVSCLSPSSREYFLSACNAVDDGDIRINWKGYRDPFLQHVFFLPEWIHIPTFIDGRLKRKPRSKKRAVGGRNYEHCTGKLAGGKQKEWITKAHPLRELSGARYR